MNSPQVPCGSVRGEGGQAPKIEEEEDERREEGREEKSSSEQDAASEQRIGQLSSGVPGAEVLTVTELMDSNAPESVASLSGSIVVHVSIYWME